MKIADLITFTIGGPDKEIGRDRAQISGALARIAAYKERARKAYAADDNFEGDRIVGGNDQQHAVDDITELKANSPDEYALQKSETCAAINDEMKS